MRCRRRSSKGRAPITVRPGSVLAAADLAAGRKEAERKAARRITNAEFASWLMYPQVFADYVAAQRKYGDVSVLPTAVYFYGMEPGEEIAVDIQRGRTLIIRYLARSETDRKGTCTLFFELNGQPRTVRVTDRSAATTGEALPKADEGDPGHVGAPMPGMVVKVFCGEGETVDDGDVVVAIEAMKMETLVRAERGGVVSRIVAPAGYHRRHQGPAARRRRWLIARSERRAREGRRARAGRLPTATSTTSPTRRSRTTSSRVPCSRARRSPRACSSPAMAWAKAPIRSAMMRLRQEGLIVSRGRQGNTVSPVTLRDIQEIFQLRLVLDVTAVRLAAGKVDAGRLRALNEAAHAAYPADDRAGQAAYLRANRTFHRYVAECSGNQRLVALVVGLMEQHERIVHLGLALQRREHEFHHYHDDLVGALIEGDADRAAQLTEAALRGGQKKVMEALADSTAQVSLGPTDLDT